jgi:hypothetical protein
MTARHDFIAALDAAFARYREAARSPTPDVERLVEALRQATCVQELTERAEEELDRWAVLVQAMLAEPDPARAAALAATVAQEARHLGSLVITRAEHRRTLAALAALAAKAAPLRTTAEEGAALLRAIAEAGNGDGRAPRRST